MTDIVERLRDYYSELTVKERSKFAAEVERLRELLREARRMIDGNLCHYVNDAPASLVARIDAALSSTLGQGESGAYPAAEGVARAEVVATPGTPGGGASSIADKPAAECPERATVADRRQGEQ